MFNNRVIGVLVQRVYGPETWDPEVSKTGNSSIDYPQGTQTYTGQLLSGSQWSAQLFAANGADQPESTLRAAYPITTFRTGAAAGFVVPVTATLTEVPAGSPVATVQLRVWDGYSVYPNTWSNAMVTALAGQPVAFGASPMINVQNIGGGSNASPWLNGLESFNVYFFVLDYVGPPIIVQQPQSQTTVAGSNYSYFSLTVSAASTGALRYQWQKNGSDISNATNSTFTVLNARLTDAGDYSAIVSNPYGSVISAVAKITVLPIEAAAPTLKSITRASSSTGLVLIGVAGRPYWLQRAPSASGPWSDVAVIVPDTGGVGTFTDSTAPSTEAYYRAMTHD
jgi:hypothetical protein